MSWSLDIIVNHPDGYTSRFEVVDGLTYNLTPMWKLAGVIPEDEDMSWLDGESYDEMLPRLKNAVLKAVIYKDKFEDLNPPNGWGDYEGFFEILCKFTYLMHKHPAGYLSWSG